MLKPLNLHIRLIMVNLVLQAMSVYLFSILSAPKAIIKEIRSIQRKFLWVGREDKAKLSLVSWEKICTPEDKGGLGLRDPKIMGGVQGAKIWWICCKYMQEPLAKIWHSKYARDRPRSQLIRFNEEPPGSHI